MSWPSNHIPKYRKHRSSGQAVVTLYGRTHYLGPYGSKASKVEYDRLVTEWLAAGRPTTPPLTETDCTVSELLRSYLRHVRKRYVKNGRPTTEQHLVKMAVKPLWELYGNTSAAEFGPIALRTVRHQMIAGGYTRNTINDNVRRIKRLFRWGVAEQVIPPAVVHALDAVEGLRAGEDGVKDNSPVEPVPEADVQATLPHLPDVVSDMVRFQRATGCRPDEVCSIRPCDVDTTGDVWRYDGDSHKTEHRGRNRVIFVGPRAAAVLRPYLLRPAESFCFSPQDSERKRLAELHANRKTPLSCGNVPGSNRKRYRRRKLRERYDADSYRRAIHRACDKAGIERWSPNRLRHSAATEIRSKYGLEAAQVVLGHSQANVTQVYAERDYALAARVAREVG